MKARLALRYFLSFGRRAVGFLALLVGTLGFVILGLDPMPWIAPYLPISYAGFYVDAAYVESLLLTTQTDYVVLGSVIAVSLLLVLSAVILLVQSPKRAVKGFLRSPLSTFRGIIRARDWLLAKVEYLNSESAKWRQTFNVLKSPYSLLRAMGFSPQMAAGLLFASSATVSGVAINETILAEKSFSNRDPGVYAASVVGQNAPLDIPTEIVEGSNTLRIDLGSTPVREITIENVSVGTVFTGSALPSGEQNVVQISGNTISGGTNTRLEIGHLIFEKSRCKKLTLTDIQAHTLIVRGNASDGQSLAPSPGTSRMRAIGGGHHQADAMVTSGGTYDRIWIQAPTSGVNGKIGTLRLTNLFTKGGECVLSKLTVGTIEILLNEVGYTSGGFSTKEFVIATTVTAANITIEDNVEVTIAEPATQ
jgi:hypothetical protein